MRRFDTPAAPPGWAGQGATLLRLVDPLGGAIAWLAPALGAAIVGYAVRDAEGAWRQLLRVGTPREVRAAPRDYGLAPLGPGPTDRDPSDPTPWRFVERDPTAATCALAWAPESATGSATAGLATSPPLLPNAPGAAGAAPPGLALTLAARLEDNALQLDLTAVNVGPVAMPVALGLRLCPTPGFRPDPADPLTLHGDDGTRLLLRLPFGDDLTLAATPTGGGTTGLTLRHAGAAAAPLAPGARRRFAVRLARP